MKNTIIAAILNRSVHSVFIYSVVERLSKLLNQFHSPGQRCAACDPDILVPHDHPRPEPEQDSQESPEGCESMPESMEMERSDPGAVETVQDPHCEPEEVGHVGELHEDHDVPQREDSSTTGTTQGCSGGSLTAAWEEEMLWIVVLAIQSDGAEDDEGETAPVAEE